MEWGIAITNSKGLPSPCGVFILFISRGYFIERACRMVTVPFWGFPFFHINGKESTIYKGEVNGLPSPLGDFVFSCKSIGRLTRDTELRQLPSPNGFSLFSLWLFWYRYIKSNYRLVTAPCWGFPFFHLVLLSYLLLTRESYRPLLGVFFFSCDEKMNSNKKILELISYRPLLGFSFFHSNWYIPLFAMLL